MVICRAPFKSRKLAVSAVNHYLVDPFTAFAVANDVSISFERIEIVFRYGFDVLAANEALLGSPQRGSGRNSGIRVATTTSANDRNCQHHPRELQPTCEFQNSTMVRGQELLHPRFVSSEFRQKQFPCQTDWIPFVRKTWKIVRGDRGSPKNVSVQSTASSLFRHVVSGRLFS